MTRILFTTMIAAVFAWSGAGDLTPARTVDALVPGASSASFATADKDGDVDDDDSGSGGDDRDPVTVTGTIPEGSLVIDILDDDGYTPPALEIDMGQQVTWVNQHHDEHTATGAAFDTAVIEPGETATVTFDAPGTYGFACQFHAEMTGTIAVRGVDGIVPTPSSAASLTPGVGSPPPTQSVEVVDFAFAPPSLTVPLGTTVVWTDVGESPHTVTAADGSFGSDILEPGLTFSHTFATAGTFAYACRLHGEMQAVIVVEPTLGGSAAPSSPSASAPPV